MNNNGQPSIEEIKSMMQGDVATERLQPQQTTVEPPIQPTEQYYPESRQNNVRSSRIKIPKLPQIQIPVLPPGMYAADRTGKFIAYATVLFLFNRWLMQFSLYRGMQPGMQIGIIFVVTVIGLFRVVMPWWLALIISYSLVWLMYICKVFTKVLI